MNDLKKTILLVEDNGDDVFLFNRALKKAEITNCVNVVSDGEKAINYFKGAGKYVDREKFPLPFIVFLDLKLPYLDGFEVLKWIRQQPELDAIVVVILTSSDEARDHQQAYSLGARSYLVKPPNPHDILEVLDSLDSFWRRGSEKSPVSTERN